MILVKTPEQLLGQCSSFSGRRYKLDVFVRFQGETTGRVYRTKQLDGPILSVYRGTSNGTLPGTCPISYNVSATFSSSDIEGNANADVVKTRTFLGPIGKITGLINKEAFNTATGKPKTPSGNRCVAGVYVLTRAGTPAERYEFIEWFVGPGDSCEFGKAPFNRKAKVKVTVAGNGQEDCDPPADTCIKIRTRVGSEVRQKDALCFRQRIAVFEVRKIIPIAHDDSCGKTRYYNSIFSEDNWSPDVTGLGNLKGSTGKNAKVTCSGGPLDCTFVPPTNNKILLAATNAAASNKDFDFGFSISPQESATKFNMAIPLLPGWEMHVGDTVTKEVYSVTYDSDSTNGVLRTSHDTQASYLQVGQAGNQFKRAKEGGQLLLPALGTNQVRTTIKDVPLQKGRVYRVKIRRNPKTLGTRQGKPVGNFAAMKFTLTK